MTKDVQMTDEEIAKFCNLGCSVDCDKFLAEYIEKRDKKKAQAINVSMQTIPECCNQCSNFQFNPYEPSKCKLGMALPVKKAVMQKIEERISSIFCSADSKRKTFSNSKDIFAVM